MIRSEIIRALKRFLQEDLGRYGDITSNSVLGEEQVRAVITANEPCVLAGVEETAMLFTMVNAIPTILVTDGCAVKRGRDVLSIQGLGRVILSVERTALNLLGRMSGIATITQSLVQKCRALNPRLKIAATRKTTPGLRYFEKKAVELGGGYSHRAGLYDALLIKDNHLAIVGSVSEALRRAKKNYPNRRIEVEVRTLAEGIEAVNSGANIVMLDNMSPAAVRTAYTRLKKLNPEIEIEVSGGITPENIERYARWADIISLGYLTHSAQSLDFSLTVLSKI